MRIGTVVVSAPEAMYCATTKSSIDSAKTVSIPVTTAGASSGSSTRRSTSDCGAPRSAAASSTSRPIITSRPRTISTTHEIENVTCPITCAVVPSPMNPNSDVNSRNRPTANTSSGVTSGSSMRMFETPEPRPRQRCRPIASAVPIGVAISIASPARTSECCSAAASVGSLRTRERRVRPEPAQREALTRRPRAPAVEREADRHEHRQQRPHHVGPGHERQHPRPPHTGSSRRSSRR